MENGSRKREGIIFTEWCSGMRFWTVGKKIYLHTSDWDIIPSNPCGPLSSPAIMLSTELDPKPEVTPDHNWVWPKTNKQNKKWNK